MTQFLPPNLLALFAPREPLPFLPPISKLPHERRRIPYSGIGTYVKLFDHPKDIPPPEKQETKAEKKERRRREKAEQMAYIIEQGIALWQPHSNNRATSDPYKTLFVARINYDTSESKLKKEFSEFGSIKKLYLIHNKINGKPRGYAFVEYDHERDMHGAYKRGDGRKIDGKRVLVDVERGRTVKGWLPRRFGGGLGNSRKGPNDTLKDMTRLGSRDKDRDRRKSRSRSKRRKSRSRSRDRKRHTPPRRDRDIKNIKSETGAIDIVKKEKIAETNGPDGAADLKKVKKEKKSKRSRSKERKHRSKSRDKDKSSKKDKHRDKEKRRRDKSGERDNDKNTSGVDGGGFTGFPPIKKEKFDVGYEKYSNNNASANHSFAVDFHDGNPNQTLNSQPGLLTESNNDGTVDSLEQYYYNNSSNANNLTQPGDDSDLLMQNYGQP